jgi:hypothetical protein
MLSASCSGRLAPASLAGSRNEIESFERFVEPRGVVVEVQLIQVDVVGPEPSKKPVDGVQNVFA